jgi:hypothetical protein
MVRGTYKVGFLLGATFLLAAPFAIPTTGASEPASFRANRPEYTLAAEVDRLLNEALAKAGASPAPLTTDEDFLRRVSLDLAGEVPTSQQVTLFALDPDPDKRARVIERLLDSDGYAELWSSYWAEVIFSHATEPRARSAQPTFEAWMKTKLAENAPWSQIATELLTATGRTQEDGQTALMFAHLGEAEEIAAESSRIFLGIQIQCANCHDHPTDIWKREQFHELAAFFPRITVRRDQAASPVAYTVASFSGTDRRPEPEELMRLVDRNRDGKITQDEAQAAPRLRAIFRRMLTQGDTNKDGALSEEELKSIPQPQQNGRGAAEHFMPDLNDPTSRGTQMLPEFFVDGAKLKQGATDEERRSLLARHFTSKGNPWFRKAFVNRMWTELLGEGFYTPVDDLGPQRTAQYEDVLNALASGFANHNYDIKWLLRAITNTQAYQRQLAPTSSESSPAFAGASPTRLRADQLYSAITQILGVEDLTGVPVAGRRGSYARDNGARRGFQQLFGFDPSTPQADILGNIPQALFLMNSPPLAGLTKADGKTVLARILKDNSKDEDALSELYLRVLSREPTAKEKEIHVAYIKEVGVRNEAFEDIFWALLNSSEFMTKR